MAIFASIRYKNLRTAFEFHNLLLMNRDDEGGISPVLTLALYFLL